MNAVVNPFRVECDRTGAKISMQWTSDVYDGLRLRTRLAAGMATVRIDDRKINYVQ